MTSLELEHAIGLSSSLPQIAHFHPDGTRLVYAAGGCIVVSDMEDAHNQTFFRGHNNDVSCVSVSSSGALVASGQSGPNADIIIWDLDAKQKKYRLREHDHGIACLAFTADERMLVSIGNYFDRQIFIWEMGRGYIVANTTLPAPPPSAGASHAPAGRTTHPAARTTPGSSFVLGDDFSGSDVPATPSPATPSRQHGDAQADPVASVAWGGRARDIKRRETGDYIFATAGPSGVLLWTLTPRTGDLRHERFQCGAHVRVWTSVAFSDDGERCFAGTTSGDFAVFLVRTRVLECMVSACSHGVRALAPLPSERAGTTERRTPALDASAHVAVAGGDGSLRVFAPRGRSMIPVHECFPHRLRDPAARASAVQSLSLCAPRRELLCSLDNGDMCVHSLPDLRGAVHCVNHAGPIADVAFPTATSERFATACPGDGTVRVWDLSSYGAAVTCLVAREHPSCVAWSSDCVVAGYEEGALRFIDGEDGRVYWALPEAHRGGVSRVRALPRSRLIVSGGENGDARVWDVRSRELAAHLKEHKSRVTSICAFHDETHALTCSLDRSFLLWDLDRQRRVSAHHARSAITGLQLCPDERRVITTGRDRSVMMWDLAAPEPIRVLSDAHSDHITALALSNDGNLFVTGGYDQVIKLWTLDGRLLCEGVGHSGCVEALCFTPDDRQLVSVGDDGNALVWNIF